MGNLWKQRNTKDYTILTEADIKYLLQNTPFDREEIQEWHRGFIRDVPNGVMNREKLVEFYRQLYPNGKVEKFCKRVYNVYNTDKSDGIDFVELMTALSITASNNIKKKLTLAFQLFDKDNSGVIKPDEMMEVIQSIYDLTIHEKDYKRRQDPKELVDLMMETFDTNKNNCLTKDEFFYGCLNNPSIAELILPYG